MGRELKCPICLSLLNSSVSLTCNHVFCNLCLTKSMKTDSHCPVCKVPYRPREIRPAPHMDNLVSIYKNMEVASGVTIHVTQNTPVTKTSAPDEECQLESPSTANRSDTGCFSRGKPRKQRKQKKGGPKELGERNKDTSDSQLSAKPSFPAKKRVHVPECIPSETPTRPTKHESRGKTAEKRPWDDSNVLKEKPSFTANGEPVFSPFFWLRDRIEGDKDEIDRLSSQTTEMDHVADTPPQIFSFSDIKDSDNGSPVETTGNGKVDTQFRAADAFDSEMFEWTQRPCSPELSSTPVKDKVAYTSKMARTQEKNKVGSKSVTVHNKEKSNTERKQGNGSEESKSLPSQNTNVVNKSSKSGKSGKSKRKQKQDKISVDKTNRDINGSSGSDDIVPNLKNTMQKKNRKEPSGTKAFDKTLIKTPQFQESNIQSHCNENINKSIDFAREKLVTAENQEDDHMSYLKKNVVSMEIDAKDKGKCQSNVSGKKRQRISKDDNANTGLGGILKGCSKTCEQRAHEFIALPKDNHKKGMDHAQTSDEALVATKDKKLRKCESTVAHICCAFCQSSNDSKVCGKMMHYSNGRPVASDYNGGSAIIHAHKDCTVWAPNVYFDDEIAFNLESELARSRRIKCSCCGIKGAALGCYEKSCRKSFHVPCAKSMPQCRWDAENFVMLCPLHSSSNLPKDLSGSQGKKTKKSTLERKSQDHQAEAIVHHNVSVTPSWKGSSNKLVLCCSGLNKAEKEIVSKFTKMPGVSLLKTYESTVTHVIASTDENGACRRTLKFLMGILDGKWILKIDWITACIEAMEPVSEEEYEIGVDIHGIRDGPLLGRLRIQNKQPKLFEGRNFYFMGDFVASYKGYLQDMVVAAGGHVLQRKPISGESCGMSSELTFIVYNAEESDSGKIFVRGRQAEAEALASSNGAKVAAHWWVLDSIAACKLQPF